MKKLFLSLGILLSGTLVGLVFQSNIKVIQASVSGYTASEFSQYCEANPSTCTKTNFSDVKVGSVSCPSPSQVIDVVYVHAGDGTTVYQLPDSGFIGVFSNSNNTVEVTANPHPHDLSWIGVTCVPGSSPSSTPTPTPTSAPTATPTFTPTNTPTVTPTVGVSRIVKTFMCYDSEQGAYWRIRNDGGVTSGTITWKINQSALTDIGTLNPGQAVYFYTDVCGVLTVYENGVSKGTATCNQNRLCEATPTPTPTSPSNRPTPTPTATITLTPGPGRVAALEYAVSCDKDEVKVEMRFTNDGKAMEGVLAKFDYNGKTREATSNSDGWAITIFGKDGENKLTGYADGFYKIEKTVEFPDNCPATGGTVLGATTATKGQVLGATTYAKTGVAEDALMQLSGVLGTLMISAGALLHAKQK